ncbi:MAG: EpsG family protein [Bacilli bacterium]|nr:EpsG family protein [Bacilli bacterium]
MIYLIVFFSSAFFIYLYEKNNTRKSLLIIGLLLPCILAGLRDVSIGTDVSWYVSKIFDASRNSSNFNEYYNTIILSNAAEGLLYRVSSHEFGFVLLEYFTQRIFDNFQVLLFALECLIILPVYFAIKKFSSISSNKKIWLSMLLYYLLLYNAGLNAIRQFISISFLLYGFSCFINNDSKKFIKVIISFVIALLFHKSSWLGLIYYFGYLLFTKQFKIILNENRSISSSLILLILIIVGGLMFLYVPGLNVVILNILNIDRRYYSYLDGNFGVSGGFVFCIPIIFVYILNRKKFKKEAKSNYFYYIYCYVLYMLCIQLSTGATLNASRLSWNFQIFNIISLPCLFKNFIKYKSETRDYGTIILICMCLFYWFYKIVYRGYYDTFPYQFFF